MSAHTFIYSTGLYLTMHLFILLAHVYLYVDLCYLLMPNHTLAHATCSDQTFTYIRNCTRNYTRYTTYLHVCDLSRRVDMRRCSITD